MTAQVEFWNWFILHEVELFSFEADQERIFDQLAAELHKVDPDLAFEFGPKDTRREFVVRVLVASSVRFRRSLR